MRQKVIYCFSNPKKKIPMFKRIFSLLSIFCVSSMFAYGPMSACWEFEADYIYWLPSVDDTYFVIQGTNADFPNGNRINNDLGFNSGFRIGGGVQLCDCDKFFRVYYTRLRATRNHTVTGDFLFATVGRPDVVSNFEGYTGTASSHIDLLYQRVDAFFSQNVLCGCGFGVNLLAGFEYSYRRWFDKIDYESAVNLGEVTHKSRSWGIGPQFGFELNYDICEFACGCFPGNLSFVGYSTGSILANKAKTREDDSLGGALLLDVGDRHTWRIVPAWHARVGLNYATCFSCFNAALEVGYEFHTYLRSFGRHVFPDDTADGLVFTNFHNFDAHGLYVGAIVAF